MPEYPVINKNVNDGDDFFLYPYYVFKCNVVFKRPFMSSKHIEKIVYVDLFREETLIGKEFPQITTISASNNIVIPSTVSAEKAKSLGIAAAKDWAKKTKMIWSIPHVDVIDTVQAYRIYYITEEEGKRYIVDSLTMGKKKLE